MARQSCIAGWPRRRACSCRASSRSGTSRCLPGEQLLSFQTGKTLTSLEGYMQLSLRANYQQCGSLQSSQWPCCCLLGHSCTHRKPNTSSPKRLRNRSGPRSLANASAVLAPAGPPPTTATRSLRPSSKRKKSQSRVLSLVAWPGLARSGHAWPSPAICWRRELHVF